jgi:virginiamycin A acetyltransferase
MANFDFCRSLSANTRNFWWNAREVRANDACAGTRRTTIMGITPPQVESSDPEVATAPHRKQFHQRELRRSVFAPVVLFLYRVLGCQRRWRFARPLLNVIQRLEGPMRSATARQIMSQFHGVEIGAYSYGDCFDPGTMPRGVSIGRYVSVATNVRVFVQNHPLESLSTHPYFYESLEGQSGHADLPEGTLEIGHDVWIGCNVVILPGCRRVGNGAVIGAGAIVTRDVPDYAIVGGNPAKRIRDRFPPEVIQKLQESKWWLLPIEEIRSKLPELQKLLSGERE